MDHNHPSSQYIFLFALGQHPVRKLIKNEIQAGQRFRWKRERNEPKAFKIAARSPRVCFSLPLQLQKDQNGGNGGKTESNNKRRKNCETTLSQL